jgi:hypothetical protein
MKFFLKIILSTILLSSLGFSIFSWWINSAFDDMCANSLISETPSPNKQMKAVIYERNCGATTGFSTQVSVLPINRVLPRSKSGNLFIADTNHGAAPNGARGGPEVRVRWRGNKVLSVIHHKAARVFLDRQKTQDITIIYSTFD